MEKYNKNSQTDLKIITKSIEKLLQLDEQERKIHKAQKNEIKNIQNVMSRCCDDRALKEKLAKNKEAYNLLEQAKNSINLLRKLLRQ